MRTAWVLVLLALGCAEHKEAKMSVCDTTAKAIAEKVQALAERDEARRYASLLADGWEGEKREVSRWIGAFADAKHAADLEVQMLRDRLRREEQLHAAADLELAALRATIQTMQKRLDAPLCLPLHERNTAPPVGTADDF